MSKNITLQSEYRLVAVGIVAMGAALLVLWQWRVTMKELDALEKGQESNFGVLIKNIQERDAVKVPKENNDQ